MGNVFPRFFLWFALGCTLLMIATILLFLENVSLRNELNAQKSGKLVDLSSTSTSSLCQAGGVETQRADLQIINKAQPLQNSPIPISPAALQSALLWEQLPINNPESIQGQSGQARADLFRKFVADTRIAAQERPPGQSQNPQGGLGPAEFKEAVRVAYEASRKNGPEDMSSGAPSPFRSK